MCNTNQIEIKPIAPQIVAKEIMEELDSMRQSQQISDEYWRPIYENIFADVLNDVRECADPIEWTRDDVLLAVGRVLCERLNIKLENTCNCLRAYSKEAIKDIVSQFVHRNFIITGIMNNSYYETFTDQITSRVVDKGAKTINGNLYSNLDAEIQSAIVEWLIDSIF